MNFKQKQLGIATRSALLTCVIAAGALMVPAVQATQNNSNGGPACKASNGNGAKLFFFGSQYAQNTSVASQFLACGYIDVTEPNFSTVNMLATNIGLANPAPAAQDFTCVVTAGWDGFTPINFASITQNLAAGETFDAIFFDAGTTPAIPVRPSYFTGYAFSCLVPTQGKITGVNAFFDNVP